MGLLELNHRGSDFINITAWLTMAITLMWFCSSALYLGVFVMWIPQEDVREIVEMLTDDGMLPLSILWFFDHLVQYFASVIITAPLFFYASIELLRRREWARVFFIVAIGLSVVANIVPLIGLAFFPEYLFPPLALLDDPLHGLRYMMGFLIVVLSALLVAMMVKLAAPTIRAEFALQDTPKE